MPDRHRSTRSDQLAYTAFANRKAEIYLYGMHTANVGRGWCCRPHLHHRMLEVNLVLQGVQTAYIGEERKLQRQGELVLIPPMREHYYEMNHSGQLRFFVLHIQVADSRFMELLQRMEPIHAGAGHPLHGRLLPLAEGMLAALQAGEDTSIHLLRHAYELMSLLETEARTGRLPSEEPGFNTAAAIALEIELLLRRDEGADLGCEDEAHRNWLDRIAAKLGISGRHCSRVFREAYGMTPRHYYSMLRQQEALHMLMNTDDTLSAIASRIGFENVQSFIRQFVKWTGVTPGRYRQNAGDSLNYLTPLEIR